MSTTLLKAKDVAKMLGIGESSVYRMVQKGILPAVKVPGTRLERPSIRFRQERIETLMRSWEQKRRK